MMAEMETLLQELHSDVKIIRHDIVQVKDHLATQNSRIARVEGSMAIDANRLTALETTLVTSRWWFLVMFSAMTILIGAANLIAGLIARGG